MDLYSIDVLQFQWGAAVGASLIAAVTDLLYRRIPNALTLSVLLSGLAFSFSSGGLAGLGDSLGACLLLAFPFVILFVVAGGGAGDAKLMGALGAWLGTVQGAVALGAVCLTGVFLALAFSMARKRSTEALGQVAGILKGVLVIAAAKGRPGDIKTLFPETTKMQKIPYGIAIFGGVSFAAAGVLSCAA